MSHVEQGATTRARQLLLDVDVSPARRLENFVAGPHKAVVDALRGVLAGDPAAHVYLRGPPGAGKSHLLQGCCAAAAARGRRVAFVPLARHGALAVELLSGLERASLVCVDDVDRVAGEPAWERALFRLYNESDAAGGTLIFAGRAGPACVALPDLRSRLQAALGLRLSRADDAHRAAVLRCHARQRGMRIGEELIAYLLSRQTRDLGALVELLEALDHYALARKRRVTVALVREYLQSSAPRSA